jgi:hypothetical protein
MDRAAASLAAFALAVAVGACGSAANSQAGASSPAAASSPPPAALATLPASAVSYLPSSVKELSAGGMAHEAGAPALRGELATWGFVAGSDRYFQGESRKLQVVDSRTLHFATADGAAAFVAFMGRHLGSYLGSFAQVRRFSTRGRSGILAAGQPCQCHLANPSFLGVVSHGPTVTWLEINGPGATRRALASLIARAP